MAASVIGAGAFVGGGKLLGNDPPRRDVPVADSSAPNSSTPGSNKLADCTMSNGQKGNLYEANLCTNTPPFGYVPEP